MTFISWVNNMRLLQTFLDSKWLIDGKVGSKNTQNNCSPPYLSCCVGFKAHHKHKSPKNQPDSEFAVNPTRQTTHNAKTGKHAKTANQNKKKPDTMSDERNTASLVVFVTAVNAVQDKSTQGKKNHEDAKEMNEFIDLVGNHNHGLL